MFHRLLYFKEYYKLIAIDLSKRQKLGANPKTIQQINFIGNLEQDGDTRIFSIIEEAKETFLDFSKNKTKQNKNSKSIMILFHFNVISM